MKAEGIRRGQIIIAEQILSVRSVRFEDRGGLEFKANQ